MSRDRIDDFTARGWWGTRTIDAHLMDRVAALGDGDAVVDPPNLGAIAGRAPRRLSWNALADEVTRATTLLHAVGLRKDDVLLMQLPNSVDQFTVYLACARLGIIVTPVPAQYRDHELAHAIGATDAKAAVTCTRIGRFAHAEMMLRLRTTCPTLRHVLVLGDDVPAGALAFDEALTQPRDPCAASAYVASAGVTANDVFTICWTSGTEARAKGVPRSFNEWLVQSQAVVDAAQLQPGQRLLNPFPMVNMGGIASAFMAWLLSGVTTLQHHPFDLAVFLDQLRDEQPHYACVAPAILNRVLQQPELLHGIRFDNLRYIGSGAAPLSEWMIREFRDRYGVQVLNMFGSNEGMSLPGTDRDIPDPAMRAAYFPRVGVPGFRWDCALSEKISTRLVDPATGTVVDEPGRPAEMRVKGPSVMSGYWREPGLTAAAFDADGYFKTGDTFEIAGDRQQYYKFAGRSKDLIKRGGLGISPDELESLIQGHAKVREVSVVAWPDDVMGERVCAVVVPVAGQTLTLDELVAWLRDDKRIAPFKLPEHLVVFDDELPRNALGKVVKNQLREHVAALAQAQAPRAPG